MTRPEIIRADSIDLQDQEAPSAKDHTRQPSHPKPLGAGPPAPHQAEALRELAAEVAEQNHRSPRVSKEWTNGDVQQLQQYEGDALAAGVMSSLTAAHPQQQDALAVAQNGGHTGSTAEDADMADAEGDDGMEDDMMDKISSSPSIDDGGYLLPPMWPQRSDSLSRITRLRSSPSLSQACGESSLPFMETSHQFHFQLLSEPFDKEAVHIVQTRKHHHHSQGEYLEPIWDDESNSKDEETDDLSPLRSDILCAYIEPYVEPYLEYYDADYELDYSEEFLAGNTELEDDSDHDEISGPLTIPYVDSEDDDDDDDYDGYDVPFTDDSRFIDSGWGGECLQELEDIDFEFVYALHTFVATVEGQANATKGDTMVLLDDSNSYWWLVRVVKDSSIGYLPAEHIETPTERLARLNKHRNIDLTSAMLGDQAEKTKNPLKKAIRRRNAKTVTFTAPTYVEASDIDYSTDEEDGEGEYFGANGEKEPVDDEKGPRLEEDEIAATEPLKPRAEAREVKSENDDAIPASVSSDPVMTSDEILEGKLESKQSRNGTVRNTDSFFKDDSVETRKITLTPNLLRDDSDVSTRTSNDSKEPKQRPSLDKLEKEFVADKSREKKDRKDKREKDKKPGMLSGLFKRKDKKSKLQDDDIDELIMGKRSNENIRVSPVPSKESDELAAEEAPKVQTPEVQRHSSKLQKHPRTEISPVQKPGQANGTELQQLSTPEHLAAAEAGQQPSVRVINPDASVEESKARDLSPELFRGPYPATTTKEQKSNGTISKMLRSASTSNSEPKPVKAKKAKSRVELDDFDSSPEVSPVEELSRELGEQTQRPIPGSFPDSYASYSATPSNERNGSEERLSESPVQISPLMQSYPPALMVDTSSQEEPASPISSPSPELIDAEDTRQKKGSSTTSTSTTTWSDANLRTFFDDDADIKDLLVVVYDKSGVVPAGPDHPITGNLFKDENAKLSDITNRLDSMLGDWLARKMRAQSTR